MAGVLMLALAGGGGAWYFLKGDSGEHAEDAKPAKKAKKAKAGPPVYVPVDQFVVNLQPETESDQYLQLAFTLQVGSLEESELIKNNMPKVRSRILLLLSSKHASEINTPAGKEQLSKEIMAKIAEPFEEGGEKQDVTEVLFTAFIIQ